MERLWGRTPPRAVWEGEPGASCLERTLHVSDAGCGLITGSGQAGQVQIGQRISFQPDGGVPGRWIRIESWCCPLFVKEPER